MKDTLWFILFLLIVLVSLSYAKGQTVDVVKNTHKYVHHIGQETLTEKASCSATAIGPNALLLATHCEEPSDDIYIADLVTDDGINDGRADIVGHIRDEFDHTILLIKGQSFTSWAKVDLSNKFDQGEDVFFFGNPGTWSDLYRKGYVEGIHKDESLAASLGGGDPDEILFALPVWHGDSGAAIFNAKGDVVAVLSGWDLPVENAPISTIAYKFAFTNKQLERAINFKAPGFVPPPTDDDKDKDKDKKVEPKPKAPNKE